MSHSTFSLLFLIISFSSHLIWVQCHTPPAPTPVPAPAPAPSVNCIFEDFLKQIHAKGFEDFFKQIHAKGGLSPLGGAIPAVYVFGDSTADGGINGYLDKIAKAFIPPYGIDFDGKHNGQFTNGRTIVDFIAQLTGLPIPPLFKSLSLAEKKNITTGVNYAFETCGILPETVKNSATSLSFDKQIDLFESTVNDSLKLHFSSSAQLTHHLSSSLFFVDIGSNDFVNNYIPSLQSLQHKSPQAFAQYLLEHFVTSLQRLHKLGARKFMVVNIGPIGCLPSFFPKSPKTSQCFEPSNAVVSLYNSLLAAKLSELPSTFVGSTFVHMDAYKFTLDVLKNPHEFGILNPWSLAKRCFEDSSICTPINLKKLLSPSP